jgi:hypothetical protein
MFSRQGTEGGQYKYELLEDKNEVIKRAQTGMR